MGWFSEALFSRESSETLDDTVPYNHPQVPKFTQQHTRYDPGHFISAFNWSRLICEN